MEERDETCHRCTVTGTQTRVPGRVSLSQGGLCGSASASLFALCFAMVTQRFSRFLNSSIHTPTAHHLLAFPGCFLIFCFLTSPKCPSVLGKGHRPHPSTLSLPSQGKRILPLALPVGIFAIHLPH